MKNESSTAGCEPSGLSFRVMQDEATKLIRLGCLQRRFRGARELSLRAGVEVEKVALVFPDHSVPQATSSEAPSLNGKEWDGLLSAAGVSLELWVQRSRESNPDHVPEEDLIRCLTPEFGAGADGGCPSEEIQERIRTTLGYSTAFYLKASGAVLP